MVTPALRRVFENEGVAAIPLRAGAEYLVREMATPVGGPVEILILGPGPKGSPQGKRVRGRKDCRAHDGGTGARGECGIASGSAVTCDEGKSGVARRADGRVAGPQRDA